MSLITVIGITYSIISPIINGLICVSFFLFYQVWKYLFLWQFGQPEAGDTGGLFFPKAIQHVFVGLYIQQIFRDPEDLDKRDFGRQSTDTSGKRPLTDKDPLTPEQQAKFDKLERERAENEIHAQAQPKQEEYGQNVGEAGKRNDGPEDFTHPAAIEPQQVIWLPRDPLGLAQAEETELKAVGIEVSTENAVLDEKGNVELRGPPPGDDEDAPFG
ncbi:hypothetical protein FRC08_000307 [Ceratobasidium sp. 394]|nr:hypothetical protein FRC08_000307 [Ceratobasidium sp. 394]